MPDLPFAVPALASAPRRPRRHALLLALSLLPSLGHVADGTSGAGALLLDPQLDAAIRAYEQQVADNPFDPVLLNNLAAAENDAGNYAEALALLTRAQRLAPDNLIIADNLTRLESWQAQRQVRQDTAVKAGPRTRKTPALLPEPPALWSARPPTN